MDDELKQCSNISDLYPNLTPDEQRLAEQYLTEYIRIVGQIAERELAKQISDGVEESISIES